MGGACPHNTAGGKKKKYSHKQARRTKFLRKGDDMIFDEVQRQALTDAAVAAGAVPGQPQPRPSPTGATVPLDEDLPGQGQWYCLFCDRHFASSAVREEHNKTKQHKKRVKMMKDGQRPHCQLDADLAGGMGKPDNGPKLQAVSTPSPMIS